MQDLDQDITVRSPFKTEHFQCLYFIAECCRKITAMQMKISLGHKSPRVRITKVGSTKVQRRPIEFYLDRNISNSVERLVIPGTGGDNASHIGKTHLVFNVTFLHQKVTKLTTTTETFMWINKVLR